jgi:hypothetical protein
MKLEWNKIVEEIKQILQQEDVKYLLSKIIAEDIRAGGPVYQAMKQNFNVESSIRKGCILDRPINRYYKDDE